MSGTNIRMSSVYQDSDKDLYDMGLGKSPLQGMVVFSFPKFSVATETS
jgi:hypothetical protein